MRQGGRDKRQRASKRDLPAIANREGPRLVRGDWFLGRVEGWRETHIKGLVDEFARAYKLHDRGEAWRVPFPPLRSDGDPVALAFIAWATGNADDDMLSAALYPREYRAACEPGATLDARDALLDRVKTARAKYERWRRSVGGFKMPWELPRIPNRSR